MSRVKFEEWIKTRGECLFWNTSDAMLAAWLAGRESMREEVTPIIFGQCDSDNVAQRTIEAIRKIDL